MQPITFVFTGTIPLLVNNPQTVDRLEPRTQAIAELTGKRNRTDDEERQIQRLKWEASLYYEPALGPYLPGIAAWKSIHDASKLSKQGKKVERGFILLTEKMPIEYDGPRDIEGMWKSGRFKDTRDAAVSKRRIMAVRAIFHEWSVKLEAMFDPEQVNDRDLKLFAEAAGRMIGIGTYRQRFGRFTAEIRV